MALWLKQSTASTIKLGPFVDSTDGVTAETALTISQADIRLSKNGGDIAQTNNATGATHDELGYYDVPLDTTDTNTLGRLKVLVSESGALPVWIDCMVVPANVWDSLFGADKLQVHVDEMTAGIITATVIATGAIDADAFAADAITDAKVASDVTIASVTGAVGSVTGAVGSVTGNVGGNVVGSVGSVTAGVTLAASAVQAIWDALTSALSTVGSIGKLFVDNINATVSSRASQTSVDTIDDFLDTEMAAVLADTNELQTDLVNGGRLDLLIDAIKAKTDNLPTDPADASDISTATTTIAGYIDTEVASILAAVDTEVAAILADTNELQTDWANGGRLDLLVDTLISNVAAILADTGTDGVVVNAASLATDAANEIADAVLSRGVSNVQDTADTTSLAGVILATFESAISGTTWTIRKTGGTTFVTKTVTLDAAADPITGVT